jgi:hypothetical protein
VFLEIHGAGARRLVGDDDAEVVHPFVLHQEVALRVVSRV